MATDFYKYVIAILIIAGVVAISVWDRRRISKKNRMLSLQIKEQERRAEELEKENQKLKLLVKTEQKEQRVSQKEKEKKTFLRLNALMKDKMLFVNSELKRRDVANAMRLSEKALSECLLQNTGMLFNDYLNDMRLEYARELLIGKDKKMTIETIAGNSGFNTRETFYKRFIKKFGVTPGNLMKTAKETQTA